MLADASKCVLIACMLIGSRNEGRVPNDPEYIARMAHLEKVDLKPLIRIGFLNALADASNLQANARIDQIRSEEDQSRGEGENEEAVKRKIKIDIMTAWNEMATKNNLPTFQSWTTERNKAFNARFADKWWRSHWREAVDLIPTDPFHHGEGARNGWRADIDYFLRTNTVAKTIEKGKVRKHKSTVEDILV